MTLAALELPTAEIKVGNGSFKVRGLSFIDVAALIDSHRAELDRLVAMLDGGAEANTDAVLGLLLKEMPELVLAAIACGADAADPADKAVLKKLPTGAQFNALREIGRLTFEEAGGVKKFVEQVVALFGASTNVIHDLRS